MSYLRWQRNNCLRGWRGQSLLPRRSGLRAGLLPCHWRISAFHYRRESFRMLSVCTVGEPHLGFLHSVCVCVVPRITSPTTPCHAPTVVVLVYATTRWETFLENSSTRWARMYALSLLSSQSVVSSPVGQPTPQMTQGWTSRLEDSGVQTDMSKHHKLALVGIISYQILNLIRVRIFWCSGIFPHVGSYRHSTLEHLYPSHEQDKRRDYEDSVRNVERGTKHLRQIILIIGSAEALPILCVRCARWERERDTERVRRKWRHLSSA